MDREDLKAVFVIVLFYAALQAVGITCPIKFLTGISCAGCGMTRAWLHALTFHFKEAFAYHPLFLLILPMLLIVWKRKKMPVKLFYAAIIIFAAAMLVCYILRMLDPTDTVVVWAPEQGLFWRVFQRVSEWGRSVFHI